VKILYGVSPIGLGHATRSMVLAHELMRGGADVRLYSGAHAARFMKDNGFDADDIVEEAAPRIVYGEMSWVALWYVRSWLAQRRNVREAGRVFEAYRPDVVVCDEEFSGMAVAEKAGTKRVFISDELDLGFARTWPARRIEMRVERWYRKLQDSVDLLIVPEEGEDVGNRRYVGGIVRPRTRSCEQVRSERRLPEGRMMLFSMSGAGVGRELVLNLVSSMDAGLMPGAFLAVTGNGGSPFRGERVFDLGVVGDNQNLIACADLVVSTAGKSTIDEAAAAGTPIVTIPVRHHAEQERNALALGYTSEDSRRLMELVGAKIGRREAPREFRGEQRASRLILDIG
jgi:UDP-N-acetylglucosamine--N-acetylmuramyl-(pentapeptide) pyrophosphoryl-undecaprenol N-acetylglucosamine transferase